MSTSNGELALASIFKNFSLMAMSKLLRNKFNAILVEQNYEKNEKF